LPRHYDQLASLFDVYFLRCFRRFCPPCHALSSLPPLRRRLLIFALMLFEAFDGCRYYFAAAAAAMPLLPRQRC